MVFESEKVMFEIYKETVYNGHYRVVYFTELGDHNKEFDINHAMAGEALHRSIPHRHQIGNAVFLLQGY